MKSYLQKLTIVSILLFASISMGQFYSNKQKSALTDDVIVNRKLNNMGIFVSSDVGTYQIAASAFGLTMVNTKNGKLWQWDAKKKKWEQLITP